MKMIKSFKFDLVSLSLYFICFFLFAGFYAGLGLIISFLGNDLTRLYSVPIRLFCSLIMLFWVIKNINYKFENIGYFYSILLFLTFLLVTYIVDLYEQLKFFNIKLEYIMYVIVYCIIPFLFFSYSKYNKIREILENSIVLSGLFLNLVAIFLYKDLISSGIARISFLQYESDEGFLSPLSLSYASSLTMSICFCKLVSMKFKKESFVLILTLISSFIPFSLGASRGSILTLFFSLFIYFLFLKDTRIKIKVLAVVPFAILCLIFATNKMGSAVFERFLGIGNSYESNDTSVTNRLSQWEQAISYINESPILGGHFLINDVYPHNILLEIFMGQGVILFLIFLFLIFYTLIKAIKINMRNDYLILVIFLHGIIMSLFSGSINTAILLFTSFGLLCSAMNYYKG